MTHPARSADDDHNRLLRRRLQVTKPQAQVDHLLEMKAESKRQSESACASPRTCGSLLRGLPRPASMLCSAASDEDTSVVLADARVHSRRPLLGENADLEEQPSLPSDFERLTGLTTQLPRGACAIARVAVAVAAARAIDMLLEARTPVCAAERMTL